MPIPPLATSRRSQYRENEGLRASNRDEGSDSAVCPMADTILWRGAIGVAPATETADRAVPVDAHGPHVVGHAAGERCDARDVVTPLRECLPAHWPPHPLHAAHEQP